MSETLSPQEQISKLKGEYEKRISEIEAQIKAESGGQSPELPHDQKRDAIDTVVGQELGTGSSQSSQAPIDANADPEVLRKVEELVAVAFQKGPYVAAKEVESLKNPALTDAFHRAMTSQLFEQFVETGKLKKVA